MRIQVGVESYVNGVRTVRLTPLDQSVSIPSPFDLFIQAALLEADKKDAQPNDGELDIPIKNASDALIEALKNLPGASSFMDVLSHGNFNVFIRIK